MFVNRKYVLTVLAVLLAVLPLRGQGVDICYNFEDCPGNSRPVGWGALPNFDFHYVGISDALAHSGTKSLGNNGTTCYTIMPDEGLNYGADSVWLTFWYYLHNNTDFFEVGYLTDATDSSTFHALDTVHEWSQEWHFFAVDLSSVPTGARIAFFGHDIFAGDGTFWIDDLHLTSQPCAAWGLRVAENRADSARLEWQTVGDPTVTIGMTTGTYRVSGNNSLTVPRTRTSSYIVSMRDTFPASACMPAHPHWEQCQIYAYKEGPCVDAADYLSSCGIPYYGTPVDPYLRIGTYTTNAPGVSGIYAGSHHINYTPGSDGGGLMVFPQTIPPGDTYSMRLGNRLGDWEADAVLYTIDVDTNRNDLLVMKYTVAMAFGTFQGDEVAHHSDTLHPAWFRIEMLDDTMAQVQPTACNFFYINAWDTVGWDEMNNMYKRRNFSGMVFDLSAYHGRRIHLRVTTCDGAVNNRWCYAYYTFECLKREASKTSCNDGENITFEAPYGFRYQWYKDDFSLAFSTAQSITVPADSTQYFCTLTNLYSDSCSITISRLALPRPQLDVRDTVVENDLPHTWRDMTFTNDADTTFIVDGGIYCDTTIHYRLHVWHNQQVRLEQPVCPGDWPVTWEGYTFTGPDSVSFALTDSHGADSTVTLVTVDAPTYETSDTLTICPQQSFTYLGVDYGGPCSFDTMLHSVQGCDSLVHVTLLPRDSNFRLMASYSVDSLLWTDTLPILLCANQTLHLRDTTPEATAWLWSLDTVSFAATATADYRVDSSGLLTLVVESGQGCLDTLTWPVVLFPTPEAAFSWWYRHPIDLQPTVHFLNQSSPEGCSYEWLVPQEAGSNVYDTLYEYEPTYTWQGELPQGDFDVRLIATLTSAVDTLVHTCRDTATETVEVVTALLQFPNMVSPNGDGVNDRWEVKNLVELGIYPMNEVWIYDAWGMLIFHARNINDNNQWWDPNATRSPDGTYYFRFMAEGREGLMVRRNGVIEVVR